MPQLILLPIMVTVVSAAMSTRAQRDKWDARYRRYTVHLWSGTAVLLFLFFLMIRPAFE